MLRVRHQRGFTIIELMIGIGLIALLSMMAVPAFQHWIANMNIRNAAEGALNGFQLARAEAVRRNVPVQLTMTGGSAWIIEAAMSGEKIQERAEEGSDTAEVTIEPAGATRVTFNGMGWVIKNLNGSSSITTVDVKSATLPGPETRPLRVFVTSAGATKMCDPAVSSPDPRAC
jgi:type IV fimbrial biogenesis protein FimT